MDSGIIATLITGGLGVAAIIAPKFKCLCHCVDCRCQSCKFGILDNAMVDTHEVEFKRITAHGTDLIYVSTHAVNVNYSDDEPHTDVPSYFLQVEDNEHLPIAKTNSIFIHISIYVYMLSKEERYAEVIFILSKLGFIDQH